MRQQMQQQESNVQSRSQHTLSVLGRKVTSLQAIQQLHDEKDKDELDVEGLLIATPATSTNDNALTNKSLLAKDTAVKDATVKSIHQIATNLLEPRR
ncbi:hypothetical protein ABG067_008587, partial [Albugo candida]